MNYLRVLVVLGLLQAFTSPLIQAQSSLRINEFMAANLNGLDDEDGDEEDWIEIYNAGATTVNLGGYYLTDNAEDLTKWMFPAFDLPAGGYLVVFASNKNRNVGEFHTNFRLSDGGEYLALVMPDGVTVVSEFSPTFPIQAPDISYGLRGNTAEETILAAGAPARALVPTDVSLEPILPPGPDVLRPWTEETFDDSGWSSGTTGVGYDVNGDYSGLIGLDVVSMRDFNETVYIRVPFQVDDPSAITSLTLRMRYDDGMIAYINGREVAWDNSPDPTQATWNSGAPSNRPDGTAVVPADFNITAFIDYLHVGQNILAIQGLNRLATSSDLLALPEIVATVSGTGVATLRYFPSPTPGEPNNAGIPQLGPIVDQEEHHPDIPRDVDDLRISARIRPAQGTVTSATLHYRVNFAAEVSVPFLDNGGVADAGIGDGVYGAVIPASASGPGDMVRWYITATDSVGGSSRLPVFVEPLDSPEYFGTIVDDPSLVTPAPVLHWFIQNPSAAETDAGTRCSLFYDGVFYDNLYINIHGQSSRSFPKKSYDIDFHPGYNFKWKDGEPRADDLNMLTTFPDKAHMRNALAYETFRDADNASHWVIPVRVQQNGQFWGTTHLVENGDEDWLIRMGINAEGALYKMYSTFDLPSGAEKKTRKNENNNDLVEFNNGIRLTGEAQRRYMYDNMDVGQIVNFLAANTIVGNTDCCHKNYYFYRDTGQSDLWQMWPWDVDLSFGRKWGDGQSYWQHVMRPDTPLFVGGNNRVPTAIFNRPETRQMYLRRVRTLMDELIKPIGTLPDALHYEPRVEELGAMLEADATLDAQKWNSHAWGQGSTAPNYPQTYREALDDIVVVYLPERRNQLYNGLAQGADEIPDAQPPGTVITFGDIEENPSNGNQDQEYVQLVNPNSFAADLSGWTLSGAVEFTFRGGTVIPANGNLYVAAHRPSWLTRSSFPNGNQGLFVVGDYSGRLSARGELLELKNKQGVTIASLNTPASPSAVQSYLRITEIMYHPPILPGDNFDQDEYEYLELKNTGTSTLNLSGVKLIDGVIFNFSTGSIANLAAGDTVLVVKNTAAFTERYGATAAARIAGEYTGNLNNGGEQLQLSDFGNEKILEFNYSDDWYPITGGRGFSLVIIDPTADFLSWRLPESWRPSGHEYGTPAEDDTALPAQPGIIISEVLSHTDLPDVDMIELYNPTDSAVNVGGWYVTDDPSFPKKFQIPANTMIDAGGYETFDENDFNPNPGVPPSFSFSSTGDEAYLYSGNGAGELTGYMHGRNFEASATGVSFGSYTDSLGREQFVPMASVTPGQPNSGPKVGPVVISEINYHPPRLSEGIGTIENRQDEFIELFNITGSPVPLYDPEILTNTWRLRGGVDFDFPMNVTIPANGRLLVVPFNPAINPLAAAAFRSKFGLAPDVMLQGPFTGRLGNEGDDIRLRRPDTPVPPPLPEAGLIPSILVDRVDYDDKTPWPVAADGFGPSLQKAIANTFGNDPIHWTAAAVTPAATYPGGVIPAIVTQPSDRIVVLSSSTSLSVVATGDAPLSYQWLLNGDSIPGATGSTYTIANANLSDAGDYQVLVLNAAGSTLSSNASVVVSIPAKIVQQPNSTQAHLGASVIFVVSATSSTPLTYQWRKNGVNLPNQTNSFLNIPSVSASDAGFYSVVVTDAVGSITSDSAVLTVLSNPVIISQPSDFTATVLSAPVDVSFTVLATSGTTLRYQWLFNGAPLSSSPKIPNVTSATLNINDVDLSHAGQYSVLVTDDFGSATSEAATLVVNTRAVVTLAPVSKSAPEGGTVSFSVSWDGSGPFLHRWRQANFNPSRPDNPTFLTLGYVEALGGLDHLFVEGGYITASQTNSVLVLTNIGPGSYQFYDVVVSNAVGQLKSEPFATLTVVGDTDRDGLPDAWETGRAGFNPNDASDALRDDDNDGVNNTDEYFSGTDYLDDQSYLRIDTLESGPVRLTFPAAAGVDYMVQYTDGLTPPQWHNLAIEPGYPSARIVTMTDPAASSQRQYRLVTPSQP